jgi:hypothetical protein
LLTPLSIFGTLFIRTAKLAAAASYLLMHVGLRWRPLQLVFYSCFANATALAGFYRYATRSQPVTWEKARP